MGSPENGLEPASGRRSLVCRPVLFEETNVLNISEFESFYTLQISNGLSTTLYLLPLATPNFYWLLKAFWFMILNYRPDYLVWHWNPSAGWILLLLQPYFLLIPSTTLFSILTFSLSRLFKLAARLLFLPKWWCLIILQGQVKPYVLHKIYLAIATQIDHFHF